MPGKVVFTGSVAIIIASLFLFASLLTAAEYDLEYSIVCDGGGSSVSANYEAESIITITGVEEGAPQSSASYSVESLLAEPEPPASVDAWMFF